SVATSQLKYGEAPFVQSLLASAEPPNTLNAEMVEPPTDGSSVSEVDSIVRLFKVTRCCPSPANIACQAMPWKLTGKVLMWVLTVAVSFASLRSAEATQALPFQYFQVVPSSSVRR